MELIKSSNTITKAVPKIVETPKHFILNSQVYDKLSFKPYPMKFFTRQLGGLLALNTSIDRTANLYTINSQAVECMYNNSENHANIIQDKNDPDIFFAIRPYGVDSNENHIFEKIQYDSITNEYTVLNTLDFGTITKSKNQVKILYETSDAFVVFCQSRDLTSTASYQYFTSAIIVINKDGLGYSLISLSNDYYTYFLSGNNDVIYTLRYITTSPANISEIYINKLNIASKQYTQIYQYEQSTNLVAKRTICNPVKIGDDFYTLFTYEENNSYYYKIMKTSINIDTDAVTTELFDIDLNGFIMDNSGSMNNRSSLYHTLKVIKSDNSTYFSVLIHAGSNSNSLDTYQQCKHILIKVQYNTFTVVSTLDLSDGCFGSLNYYDTSHQVFFLPNYVLFTVFNNTSESMEITYRKAGIFSQIGFDSLNRFITQSTSGSIDIMSEGNATTLYAKFDKNIYSKQQSGNIEGTINFYAKNFLDEYVDTNIKLTLIGPVVFKENNKQELIISTSIEGIKTVPIILTGYGNIEVIITQNT